MTAPYHLYAVEDEVLRDGTVRRGKLTVVHKLRARGQETWAEAYDLAAKAAREVPALYPGGTRSLEQAE